MSNKRATLRDRSPLSAFIGDSQPAQETTEEISTNQQVDISTSQQPDLERTGFYIRPDQNSAIELLRGELRKKKVKANRSEIIRAAIDLLLTQDHQIVVNLLTNQQVNISTKR